MVATRPDTPSSHARLPERSRLTESLPMATECPPFALCVGVISSSPHTLLPLLRDLDVLAKTPFIVRLVVVLLDNASPTDDLKAMLAEARALQPRIAVVTVGQQRRDASRGAFGALWRERTDGRAGIAVSRTMIQRYVGELMRHEPGGFGWILDDDMRIDERAHRYLSWLPAFRHAGVDALIGACEGVSPNPPLHGVQGQLFDLLRNLTWLLSLPASATLPNRSAENAVRRREYPDYYYDLSRRHAGHLDTPHWIEPVIEGESVAEARARLIRDAQGILRGVPVTRPLVAVMPRDPLAAATDSVNRGGHTLVLNHQTLTAAPNVAMRIGTREARRSDMLWAIINRQCRRRSIKAVAFPAVHVGSADAIAKCDFDKVQAEVIGAAVYAALLEFLDNRPDHALNFSAAELESVRLMAIRHRDRRLDALRRSFARILEIRDSLRRVAGAGQLDGVLAEIGDVFTAETFGRIRQGVVAVGGDEVEAFVGSLRAVADDYASAPPPDMAALRSQLECGVPS